MPVLATLAVLAALAPARAAPREALILAPASAATTFRVEAHFPAGGETCEAKRRKPVRARYRGRVEVVREADGTLAVLNRLSFDDYLKGLAEVPRSWPLEALRAQVIAARSYALYSIAHPRPADARRGVDICATDRCQVYRGAAVELGAFGDRWARAVESTRGLALLYRGVPAQAFYFSTSTGRTRTNTQAFGGAPRPYLPSVAAHDGDAPLAQWRVAIPLAHVARILRAAGAWPGGAIERAAERDGAVVLSGAGRAASLGKGELRTALNDEAACAYPSRYPSASRTGAHMPLTVPSRTYSLAQRGDAVVLAGRGWGHGVGMSQYGARALAERGWSAAQILAHFYGGLRPRRAAEPDRIRVLAVEGANVVRVEIEGSARASTATGGTLAVGRELEARGGARLRIRRGVGPSAAPVLEIGLNTRRLEGPPGASLPVRFVLNRPALVAPLLQRDGAPVARLPGASYEAGASGLHVRLVDAAGAPLSAGAYAVIVEAFDGIDRVRSPALPVSVVAPSPPRPPAGDEGGPGWAIAAGAGAAALALAALAAARARRATRR